MIKDSKLIGTKVSMPYGWHEFKVGDLFDVLLSAGDNKISDLPKGEIPLITSGASNNGIAGFVAFGDGDAQLFDEGVLTADMFGNVLFQPNSFYAVSHGRVNVLKPIDDGATMLPLLFIASLIKKQTIGRYGFDYMLSSTRLHDLSIELPVTVDDTPDYEFMETYIRELENQRIRELENQRIHELETYLQVTGLNDIKLTLEEEKAVSDWRECETIGHGNLKFKKFAPLDLFDFPMAKSLNKDDLVLKENGSPYVTRTVENNGVNMLVDLTGVSDEYVNAGNEFSFGLLGLTAFYQKNPYVAGQFVRRFVPKFDMNETLSMYFKTLIDKLKPELQTTSIKGYVDVLAKPLWDLPVTNDGTPDYDFMETFIRAQEKLVMQCLDNFRQLQIDTTKAVI